MLRIIRPLIETIARSFHPTPRRSITQSKAFPARAETLTRNEAKNTLNRKNRRKKSLGFFFITASENHGHEPQDPSYDLSCEVLVTLESRCGEGIVAVILESILMISPSSLACCSFCTCSCRHMRCKRERLVGGDEGERERRDPCVGCCQKTCGSKIDEKMIFWLKILFFAFPVCRRKELLA